MAPTLKKQKIDNKGKFINKSKAKVTIEQEENKKIEEESSSEESASDSVQSILDEDDDIDSNVEVDVDGVSSEDSEEEERGGDEDGSDDTESESYPKLKKKSNKDDGSESFANAFNSIINSKLKAYDRKDPILARNKVTLKKLESEKLENKAKRALLAEKKQLQDKYRIKQLLPVASSSENPNEIRQILEKEKNLKKIAQKGVVKLFNAVLSTQIKTSASVGDVKLGSKSKEELLTEVSKDKFLDLIQAAGEE
ncbi:unnamed protein product [Candida verbasci]|uniref:Rrp15p-domain-containing protein n=1 Tax=Candida verbasci TaxID=1227364 RepID=A0A9W4XHH4_9ASCO|nr:unnamed protein product [Candida verbasci]